jgi:S1/P1 Nuclease
MPSEYRYAEGKLDRLPDLAAELVHLKVDIIVVGGDIPTRAAKKATKTIPIVIMGTGSDPVSFHRGNWHYINMPFKPSGEPAHVQEDPPQSPNVLTALADNESIVRNEPNGDRRAVALAWLFHLVGDVHQPLHTTQLFTLEYPDGDRGGNEICIRVKPKNRPIALHKFWDDMLTGSENLTVIRNLATALRNRPGFAKSNLTELENTDVEIWAKESFTQGVTIGYRNGTFRGTPKGHASDCADLQVATVLPSAYITTAKPVAERRMVLAGYRLADLLTRLTQN